MRLATRKKTNLTVYRRHDADCPHRKQGREYLKCSCGCKGLTRGQPIRQSLQTRTMQEALRQVADMEDPRTALRRSSLMP